MPLPVMAISAIVGAALAAKKNQEQQKQAQVDRETQAKIAQYSPWTHMEAHPVASPESMLSAMAGGATGGLGMGQMIQGGQNADAAQAQQAKLTDAQANYYNNANRQNIISQNQGSAGSMGGLPPMNLPDYNLQQS